MYTELDELIFKIKIAIVIAIVFQFLMMYWANRSCNFLREILKEIKSSNIKKR